MRVTAPSDLARGVWLVAGILTLALAAACGLLMGAAIRGRACVILPDRREGRKGRCAYALQRLPMGRRQGSGAMFIRWDLRYALPL